MIKVYLAAIPTLYEGEDVEIRYSMYKDDALVIKESIFMDYMKPAVVGLASVLTLLEKLKDYKNEEIKVIINDGALEEQLKGASTTRNGDVIKMTNRVRRQIEKFPQLSFFNVTKRKASLLEWKEITG